MTLCQISNFFPKTKTEHFPFFLYFFRTWFQENLACIYMINFPSEGGEKFCVNFAFSTCTSQMIFGKKKLKSHSWKIFSPLENIYPFEKLKLICRPFFFFASVHLNFFSQLVVFKPHFLCCCWSIHRKESFQPFGYFGFCNNIWHFWWSHFISSLYNLRITTKVCAFWQLIKLTFFWLKKFLRPSCFFGTFKHCSKVC